MNQPDRTAAVQDRRARYAAAMDAVTGGTCPMDLIEAVMAVADAELMQAQAEAHQYRTALQGAARRAAAQSPADRSAVYAEVAEIVRCMAPEHPKNASWVQDCHHIADRIDEAAEAAGYSQALATPPSAEASEYIRERLARRLGGERPAQDEAPEICGAEPPNDGTWGDCWCTLPPGHDGEHRCQPCTDRHGAPGWSSSEPSA